MAPSQKIFSFKGSVTKRTEAPRCPSLSPPLKKFKSLNEILDTAPYAVIDRDYSDVGCEECGSGDRAEEMLLCDKCDKGFHMFCLRPIVVRIPIGPWFCHPCSGHNRLRRFPLKQTKIVDFFRIQKCSGTADKCASPQDTGKRRRRCRTLVMHKKRRRLLPFHPTEDPKLRLQQMGSLATALTALRMEFSNDLSYMPGMAPKSANQARFEKGGMQVLCKEDAETLEHCKDMCRRGEWPPLSVVSDPCEGFTVEADSHIKDMTLITEYTGDIDYIKNREHDDCDSMMTLLLAKIPANSLVICPDKRGNIARFINGINNHTPEGRKKQNLKCVRYNVNGECRVLLVAIRDIAKGERLYYDYNGYEHEYPTHHFV
ncbi:probable Histone-lysine N-methyltransferase ATXR5 [Telopea speciosissima]|uniref:probable Histone-lysine N-methyltransferase ATXR5 n=1 Tax=Telopea speciosissima TaxID=54955 RepID=UPI001CC393C7|nr:probable Histone-lysine N-methyltransferase ATXR5 [Telopea speciosissima]